MSMLPLMLPLLFDVRDAPILPAWRMTSGELIAAQVDFSSADGWTLGAEFSIAGNLSCVSDESQSQVYASVSGPLSAAKTYVLRVQCDAITEGAAGTLQLVVDGQTFTLITFAATGQHEQSFSPADGMFAGINWSTPTQVVFLAPATAGDSYTVSTVSLTELPV